MGKIQYKLIRKNIKSITIKITPNLQVIVTANPKIPLKIVDDFVVKNNKFILEAIEKYSQRDFIFIDEKYCDGDYFIFLGKEYKVNIMVCHESTIKLGLDYLEVRIDNEMNADLIDGLINKWVNNQIEDIFLKVFYKYYKLLEDYNIVFPEIKYKRLKASWGICSKVRGRISINKALISTPIDCIEYVVLHELVHLVHSNHSKDFYNLLKTYMPDYKNRENKLKKYIVK